MSLDIVVSGIGVIKGNPRINQDSFKSELDIFDKGPYELNAIQKITAVAFIRALADAGVEIKQKNSDKISIFLGNAYGIEGFKADFREIYKNSSPSLVNPSVFTFTSPNSISSWIGMQFCIEGINLTFTNGCISGSQAILAACDSLISGSSDIAIAGGISLICEDLQEEFYACGFQQELAGFLLLERKQSTLDAGRKVRILIKDFQAGFLSDTEIEMLNNYKLPTRLEESRRIFTNDDGGHVLMHLGNSLKKRRFTYSSEIRAENNRQRITCLNEKMGNAFSAAGILGVSCVQGDHSIFFDVDSYGAYIGLSIYVA